MLLFWYIITNTRSVHNYACFRCVIIIAFYISLLFFTASTTTVSLHCNDLSSDLLILLILHNPKGNIFIVSGSNLTRYFLQRLKIRDIYFCHFENRKLYLHRILYVDRMMYDTRSGFLVIL